MTGPVAADAGDHADVLTRLDEERVEARSLPATPVSPAAVRDAGWRLEDLWLPAVVCDADALRHNLDRFARWCADRGVDHAPHGKTTMAPRLWWAQLQRGAWAITAATVAQARTMRRYGVPRVLLANEVVDPAQLRWVAATADDPAFELCCLVDSAAGLGALQRAVVEAQAAAPLPVLVELGVAGRRTGARGRADARGLAADVAGRPGLRLAGIEGYEGVLPVRRDAEAVASARRWLEELTALAVDCDADGLFEDTPEVLLTAGGSGYVDLVAEAFAEIAPLSRPVRTVVRSGCYVTHDHLSYERSSPLRSAADDDPLRPALTCHARVLSCPEPGRALLGVGKRDVPFDLDLPVPLSVRRDGSVSPVDARARIVELNDHHGFCDHEPGLLAVGDVVELGLSHPCTAFDKWPLIPVLDADARIVDAIRTVF
jgi:D-serine deaminase-like pyridoxal phosphate-dependent protein